MKLSLFNFPAKDSEKLEKILRISTGIHYELQSAGLEKEADLLLVYGEDTLKQEPAQTLAKERPSKIVVVAKNAPAGSDYHHIPTPLIASRVLKSLEKITGQQKDIVPSARPQANAEKRDLRVLVVDDSHPMQRALEAEIKRLDMPTTIDFADCGEQALEYVTRHQYDFIFLDIIMPGIDGFETCSKMREMPEVKRVPIIMLSAKNSPLDEVKGVMAGCSTYMTKPIVHEEFQKVIRRISRWVENYSGKQKTAKAG